MGETQSGDRRRCPRPNLKLQSDIFSTNRWCQSAPRPSFDVAQNTPCQSPAGTKEKGKKKTTRLSSADRDNIKGREKKGFVTKDVQHPRMTHFWLVIQK